MQVSLAAKLCQNDLFSSEVTPELFSRISTASDVFQPFECCPITTAIVYQGKTVTIDGISYALDDILCVGVAEDGIPHLLKVEQIVCTDKNFDADVFFVGSLLQSTYLMSIFMLGM